MIYPIIAYGHPVLRAKCEEIKKDHPNLKEILVNMQETMENAEGIGLAAPQVGLSIRLFLVDATNLENEDINHFKQVFINPVIIEEWDEPWAFEEGCLSIPKIRENVVRHSNIKIKYLDENFKEHTKEFDGMIARIIQHEYDHIEGILFTDHITPLRKKLLKNKLRALSAGKIGAHYRMKYATKKR